MAGRNHVAVTVGTVLGVGKDVKLARFGIHERAPEVGIHRGVCAKSRILLVIEFVDKRGDAYDVVFEIVRQAVLLPASLIENVLD